MRTAADLLGLAAYLTLMYGRLPDRDLLEAAYLECTEKQEKPADADRHAPVADGTVAQRRLEHPVPAADV
ncbi:MAG: hypothetical protein A2148_05885 [Chloroflexi bacterium RBG_16_68_14]|nr:MAG: hypothetical protein A2148_05885 [Chloroflexi bacterium RBG_16_68_14]